MKTFDFKGKTVPEMLNEIDPTWRIKMVPSMGRLNLHLVTGRPLNPQNKPKMHPVEALPLP